MPQVAATCQRSRQAKVTLSVPSFQVFFFIAYFSLLEFFVFAGYQTRFLRLRHATKVVRSLWEKDKKKGKNMPPVHKAWSHPSH